MKNKIQVITISLFFIIMNLNYQSIAQQQWGGATNQTGYIYRTGNVGIGSNSSVTSLLQLSNSTGPELKFASTTSPIAGTLLGKIITGATQTEFMGQSSSSINFFSESTWTTNNLQSGISFFTRYYGTTATERMRISSSGNIGIGTINPAYKLEVNGTAMINGTALFSDKVGIGYTPPTEGKYRLYVMGGIKSEEVIVELSSNWPDYVFEPGYKLQTLFEVESYIKINNHLPDTPSATFVEKEGINLGEMDAILLKKIEELTLYVIELKKENAQQQTEIFELKSSIAQSK